VFSKIPFAVSESSTCRSSTTQLLPSSVLVRCRAGVAAGEDEHVDGGAGVLVVAAV